MMKCISFSMTASRDIIEVKCTLDLKAVSSYRESANPITGEMNCTHVVEFGGFNYSIKVPYEEFDKAKLTYDFGFKQN